METTRKSTGKRTRFSVFNRDGFTCQYCGAQPPDVLLVIDHITPVAHGGLSDLDNLITSCEECNQGKGSQELGLIAPRPDADLLFLSAQQEIAELRRYQVALSERETALQEMVAALHNLWSQYSNTRWLPPQGHLRQLLLNHPIDVVGEAVITTALAIANGSCRSKGPPHEDWKKYMYGVIRRIKADLAAEGWAE